MKKEQKFHHLSYEERVVVGILRKEREGIRAIASILGRSPNTVSYELHHKQVKGRYEAAKAQRKTYWKRYLSKQGGLKLALDQPLQSYVVEKLKHGWSPERISGRLKKQNITISKKAIYKFVDSRCLERHLFWRGRKRKKKVMLPTSVNDGKKYIESRPILDGSGHLEVDFIVSKRSSVSLLVVVDRYSRRVRMRRIENRKHATVSRVLAEVCEDFNAKTITVDNDIAFSHWRKLESILGAPMFFCHPYHSWEKGLVENTNRWIRVFVPKKRDLHTITLDECRSIEEYLNNTPRQCLDFQTASEVHLKGQINHVSSVS